MYWARAVTRLVPGPVSPATARAGHCGGRGLDGREGGEGFLEFFLTFPLSLHSVLHGHGTDIA